VDKFFRQFPDQPEMKQARGLTRLRKNLLELAEESYRKELREHGSREKGRKQEKAEKAREKGGRKGTYLREKGGRKGTYLNAIEGERGQEKGDIPKCYWKETAREKRKEKGDISKCYWKETAISTFISLEKERKGERKGTYLNAIGKKQLYPLLSLYSLYILFLSFSSLDSHRLRYEALCWPWRPPAVTATCTSLRARRR
jgi:hypothetical protein